MTAVPVFRNLTDADRKRWSRLTAKAKPVPLPAPPSLKKLSPKEAAEEVETRMLGGMLRNRESFATLVQTMRHLYGPRVAWMTDEQIAQFARDIYREKVRESTTRAFMKRRADEMKIHIGGI